MCECFPHCSKESFSLQYSSERLSWHKVEWWQDNGWHENAHQQNSMVHHSALFLEEGKEDEKGKGKKYFGTPLPERDGKYHSLLSEIYYVYISSKFSYFFIFWLPFPIFKDRVGKVLLHGFSLSFHTHHNSPQEEYLA